MTAPLLFKTKRTGAHQRAATHVNLREGKCHARHFRRPLGTRRSPPQPRGDTAFSDFLRRRDLLRPVFGRNTGMSSIFESRLAVRCQSQDCQVSHLKHNSSSCCRGNLSQCVHNISFHKKETTPAALQPRDAPASDSRQIEEHQTVQKKKHNFFQVLICFLWLAYYFDGYSLCSFAPHPPPKHHHHMH